MKNQQITVNGIEFKSIRKCADYFSVKFSTFYKHYKAGEKTELIVAKYSKLTTKVKQFEYDGIMYHSLFDFCKRNKMSEKLIPLLREILK